MKPSLFDFYRPHPEPSTRSAPASRAGQIQVRSVVKRVETGRALKSLDRSSHIIPLKLIKAEPVMRTRNTRVQADRLLIAEDRVRRTFQPFVGMTQRHPGLRVMRLQLQHLFEIGYRLADAAGCLHRHLASHQSPERMGRRLQIIGKQIDPTLQVASVVDLRNTQVKFLGAFLQLVRII